MDEKLIDLSPDYIRGKWTLAKFNTVEDFVKFWLAVGPFWGRYPQVERVKPWFSGIESELRSVLRRS